MQAQTTGNAILSHLYRLSDRQNSRKAMIHRVMQNMARGLFCGAYEEADVSLLMWLDKYFGDFVLAQRRLAVS